MREDPFEESEKITINEPAVINLSRLGNRNFNQITDASQYATAAISSQGEIPNDQLIAFASRTLHKADTVG